jgi:hypothetical protein
MHQRVWELHIHDTHAAVACTNASGNCIYTTPMPLQNESKRNDKLIKERQSPSKNIEILIRLYLIINDYY